MQSEQWPERNAYPGSLGESGELSTATKCDPWLLQISTIACVLACAFIASDSAGAKAPNTAISSASHTARG
jgi:hypothetical protein